MPVYKITGINLKVTPFGEADKIVTVFSKEKGKLKVLAKGARKSGSRLSGKTELFVLSKMQLASGRNFEILTDSQIIESFQLLRQDLKKLNLALYFIWLVEVVSPLNQANEKVFELLEKSLKALIDSSFDLKNGSSWFEKELAVLEGVSSPYFKEQTFKKYFKEYLDKSFPAYFSEVLERAK